MGEKKIRLLRADEIECRAATINEKGMCLLLFKDARVDQRILDETFTPFGWRRSHQSIDGNLYCTVEVWDTEKNQWIAKQDVGTMSYSEKEKGQASDSFKRACFNWGIGRELYSAPFIWIPAERAKIQMRGDRYYCNEHFNVTEISYNEDKKEILTLTICNSRNEAVFSYKNGKAKSIESVRDVLGGKTGVQSRGSKIPEELQKELRRTGVPLEAVLDRYQLTDISQMTLDIYEQAMKGLRSSRSKAA